MTIAAGLRPNGKSVFHELLMSNMLTRLQNRVTNQKQNKNIRSFTKKKRASEKKVWQEGGGIVAGGSMQTFLHIIEGKTRLGRFLRLQGGIDS